jgi:hypothetical protein
MQKPKSKLAAGLLAILLGLGVYNFYLNNPIKAAIQLTGEIISLILFFIDMAVFFNGIMQGTDPPFWSAAFIIGCIIGVPIGLWQFIEGIMILCGKIDRDGKGNPIA